MRCFMNTASPAPPFPNKGHRVEGGGAFLFFQDLKTVHGYSKQLAQILCKSACMCMCTRVCVRVPVCVCECYGERVESKEWFPVPSRTQVSFHERKYNWFHFHQHIKRMAGNSLPPGRAGGWCSPGEGTPHQAPGWALAGLGKHTPTQPLAPGGPLESVKCLSSVLFPHLRGHMMSLQVLQSGFD